MGTTETDEGYFARRMAEEAAQQAAELKAIDEIANASLKFFLEEAGKKALAEMVKKGVISQEQLDRWLAPRQPNPDQP